MIHPIESTRREARVTRLSRWISFGALAAAVAACGRDQPVASEAAAPERSVLTWGPACDPYLVGTGTIHEDSILAPETWSRTGNPHRVETPIHIEDAATLTIEPGVVVCVGPNGGFWAGDGGRLVANGLDTAGIVLTATYPTIGWWGIRLNGSPASPSALKHVTLEHSSIAMALSTDEYHAADIDSTVFRQNQHGLHLWGRGTTIRRSRVDTVTSDVYPAVTLGNLVTWERNVVRAAAGVGLSVLGTNNVTLLGGRIENSGGVGLQVTTTGAGFVDAAPVRVTGGAGRPAELVVSAFPRIYPAVADQDSLLGNARDTVVVTGGLLKQWAQPGPALPWRVTGDISVENPGILIPKPGAVLVLDPSVTITATNGGRVLARGTAAAPVRFTAAPGSSWGGLLFDGAPALASYLTNVRLEYANAHAVEGFSSHPVVIDSAVFRHNGLGVLLSADGSRLSRSRVDSARFEGSLWAAVDISGNTILESTLIRGAGGTGLRVRSNTAQVLSCEIRENAGDGVHTWVGGALHNCNLVGNGGVGIDADNGWTLDAENNWWGDAAGPTGTNGDGVSGPVDYTPWRTTPFTLPYVP